MESIIDSAMHVEALATFPARAVYSGQEEDTEADGRRVVPIGANTVVSESIAQNFARLLRRLPLVECVAWAWDGKVLRVWTVLSRRDREVQRRVYDAESWFLDALQGRQCDFTIVFRDERELNELLPTNAKLLAFAD